MPSRKGGIRIPGPSRSLFHNSFDRDDGDGVFGSEIIDTIGPFQADEPLPVALSEGHNNAAPPQRVNAFAELVGEAVGRQALRTGRVDLFQQHLGRGADLLLLPQQRGEERQDAPVRFAGLFAVVREQSQM